MNNKTKKFILLPVFVGTTVFGVRVAAATLSEVRADYVSAVAAYQTVKSDFVQAKRQYQQMVNKEFTSEMFTKSQDFLLNGDRTLLTYLQWMEVKVNATDGLDEGLRSDMLGRIASNREWLLAKQPVIEQATKKGELVDVARNFATYWDEHDHQYKRYNGYLLHAKIAPVLSDAQSTSEELAETVKGLSEQGEDVKQLTVLVEEYAAAVKAAEDKVREAKAIYDNAAITGEAMNAAVKAANQSLRAAYDELHSADQTLDEIMTLLQTY